MRNKRSGNSSKQGESSDDSPLEPNTSGSQSSSSSGKRAADMLANYKSNLDPSSGANSSSSKSNNSSGSVSLSEVRDGAHRLATELDEFLAKAAKNNRSFVFNDAHLTDEAIPDLQLATARKLREVRCKMLNVVDPYRLSEILNLFIILLQSKHSYYLKTEICY